MTELRSQILETVCCLAARLLQSLGDEPARVRELALALSEAAEKARREAQAERGHTQVRAATASWQEQPVLHALMDDLRGVEAELGASEERLRTITENAPDLILQLDRAGCITYLNRVVAGRRPEEVLGKPFTDWISSDFHPVARGALERVLRGGVREEFEAPGAGADGELRWYQVRLAPVTAGRRVVSVILVGTDITERRRAAEALLESKEGLEVRIAERTAELRTVNQQLQAELAERERVEKALRENEERLRLKLDSILLPGVEVIEEELGNILDAQAIQSMMEDFNKLTDMALAVLDVKGNVLVAVGWQDICTRFHRVHPESARNCTESDLFLASNVRQGQYVDYKCKNSLCDVVTPLYIGGKHVGNIYTGQFFYDDEVVDVGSFIDQAARYGFDRESYLQALQRVPRLSRERVNTLMDFLVKFSDLVSRLSFSNLKLARAMAEQGRIEAVLREKAARGEAGDP
ncbi:MAG: PocR ligand-binding domain-containing protein [Deltaproteobacteria bacterium]|nr:PocR ligand-binding domain-containing protein [Deltaproteobacteria bacterium]